MLSFANDESGQSAAQPIACDYTYYTDVKVCWAWNLANEN